MIREKNKTDKWKWGESLKIREEFVKLNSSTVHGNAVLFFCVRFYVESSTEYDNRGGRDIFDNNVGV